MSDNGKQFEPLIIGFTCNWCSYRAADMAGISRIKYPSNVRLIRLMCSGRLDPEFVLKALAGGADGVLITGCHPGECHYLEQNFKALSALSAAAAHARAVRHRAGPGQARLGERRRGRALRRGDRQDGGGDTRAWPAQLVERRAGQWRPSLIEVEQAPRQ